MGRRGVGRISTRFRSAGASVQLSRRSALTLGPALLAAGCGRSAAPVPLTWWAMSTQGENAPLLLPAFTRMTGIAVDVQPIPWTAAHEKVLTGYAGGSLPDVLMVSNYWLAELAMLDAIAPVPEALTAGLLPAARAAATVAGRVRGVPWIVDTEVQFVRRDLIAAAGYGVVPGDWAGWRALAVALKRRRPDDYAVFLPLDWPEVLLALGAQQDAPMLRDRASRGNFSTPQFRAALAFYKGLFDDALAPAIVWAQAGDPYVAFGRGWFALLPASSYAVGDLARRTAVVPRAVWTTAAMPGRGGAAPALIDGSSLVVTRQARDPAAAWALVRYLTSPAAQLRLHGITGDLPSRQAAWPALAADPVAPTFAAAFTRGVAPPSVPEWEHIRSEVQAIAERCVRGEFGVDAATRAMDTAVDRILAKRRWLLDRGRVA